MITTCYVLAAKNNKGYDILVNKLSWLCLAFKTAEDYRSCYFNQPNVNPPKGCFVFFLRPFACFFRSRLASWSAAVSRFVKLSPVSVPVKTSVKTGPLPSAVIAPLLGNFSFSDVIAWRFKNG